MGSAAKQSQAKKKKRKPLRTNPMRSCKVRRVSSPPRPRVTEEEEGVCNAVAAGRDEFGRARRNLDLIFLLQNKDVDTQNWSELVKGRWKAGKKVGKKTRDDGKQQNVDQPCLDLQKSSELHVNLNLHQKLLNPISCVARHTLSQLSASDFPSGNSSISDEGLTLFSAVVCCAHLFFTPYTGLTNESMAMWISIVETAIELLNQVFSGHLQGHKVADLVLQFSCFVIEPFSKYLWSIHLGRLFSVTLSINSWSCCYSCLDICFQR